MYVQMWYSDLWCSDMQVMELVLSLAVLKLEGNLCTAHAQFMMFRYGRVVERHIRSYVTNIIISLALLLLVPEKQRFGARIVNCPL